ncbi:unnamed protein product [Euphydryas editha]|uniref:DNA repair protein RAD52-like protein n=1 Tax=Euphydryas editha TaxID=104508 RepID=A0AAU9TQI5_EUPED|nr:unnamed protein product [Euphydryas editha]
MVDALLEEEEPLQRRQQLVNFGHAQWGFNNWSWSVTKQDLDFVELTNGKYTAGVVAFVSITVKTLDIHRENIGYATSLAPSKGLAIHRARKCAVTNALRETLLSFGGSVATELLELLDAYRPELGPEPLAENNQNALNKLAEPKNSPKLSGRKEPPCVNVKNAVTPPVAKAHPMPPVPCAPLFAPPRLAPPPAPVFPNYYEYAPWHFYEPLERACAPANATYPPRNLLVGRECKRDDFAPPPQGCWIKPTIFYDGFWTEQKVKKWVAEQVEKQFPEEDGAPHAPAHANAPDAPAPPAARP